MSRLRGNGGTKDTLNIEEPTNDDHARQLCSTTHMDIHTDRFYKEFFKIYIKKKKKIGELIK